MGGGGQLSHASKQVNLDKLHSIRLFPPKPFVRSEQPYLVINLSNDSVVVVCFFGMGECLTDLLITLTTVNKA